MVFTDYCPNITIWSPDSLYWFVLYCLTRHKTECLQQLHSFISQTLQRLQASLVQSLLTGLFWRNHSWSLHFHSCYCTVTLHARNYQALCLNLRGFCSFTWNISGMKLGKKKSSAFLCATESNFPVRPPIPVTGKTKEHSFFCTWYKFGHSRPGKGRFHIRHQKHCFWSTELYFQEESPDFSLTGGRKASIILPMQKGSQE